MASVYLSRLYDEYRRAAKIGADVMDAAASDNRDLTSDEITRRDAAYADVQRLKSEIDKVREFEELRAASDAFREVSAPIIERGNGSGRPVTIRDLFRQTLANGFVGMEAGPSPERELRALQSAGGSAIESSFLDYLTVYERTATPLLSPDVVGLIGRESGNPLIAARIVADPAHGGTVTAEAAGINELDATISSATLTSYKFAITNLWSSELAQDNAVNLEQAVAFTTARELSQDIGAMLTTGTGSSQPEGFLQNASNGGTASGTGSTYGTYFGPTDLVTLFYSLAAPYRANGTWLMNGTTLAQVRNARTTAGEHIWQPAIAAGAPETILGRPVRENPAMANGSAAKAIAFGDFSRFLVSRVLPVRVESSIAYKFSTDQLALRTIERIGSSLVDVAAIKVLTNAAV